MGTGELENRVLSVPVVLESSTDSTGSLVTRYHAMQVTSDPADEFFFRICGRGWSPQQILDQNPRRFQVAFADYLAGGAPEHKFSPTEMKVPVAYSMVTSRYSGSLLRKFFQLRPLVQYVARDSYRAFLTASGFIERVLVTELLEEELPRCMLRSFYLGDSFIESRPRIVDVQRISRQLPVEGESESSEEY